MPHQDGKLVLRFSIFQDWLDDGAPFRADIRFHLNPDDAAQFAKELNAWCSKPLYAVQFHPESVMTQDGYRLLANWLKVCGQENAVERSKGLQPKVAA